MSSPVQDCDNHAACAIRQKVDARNYELIACLTPQYGLSSCTWALHVKCCNKSALVKTAAHWQQIRPPHYQEGQIQPRSTTLQKKWGKRQTLSASTPPIPAEWNDQWRWRRQQCCSHREWPHYTKDLQLRMLHLLQLSNHRHHLLPGSLL